MIRTEDTVRTVLQSVLLFSSLFPKIIRSTPFLSAFIIRNTSIAVNVPKQGLTSF